MKLEFLPEARLEFYAAAERYEDIEAGLGSRFRNEVRSICRLILQNPLLWRERRGGFRRVNCPVFPYYIAFFIRNDTILVAAVAHAHQHPNYWRDRL